MRIRNLFVSLGLVFSLLLCQASLPASAATGTQPANPNASDEAKELLQTLYNIRGKGIITGVYNWHAVPEERTETLKNKIGVYPGIWNTDFGYGDNNTGAAEMHEVRNNVVETAIRHAAAGDIVSLMWHAVKPSDSERDGWGSVQSGYSNAAFDMLLTEGTILHNQLLAQIDDIATYLKVLRDKGIPVLWRPYHECNGGWFWWGGQNGGDRFVRLWRLMYDRYTNYHGLDNLIWVWTVTPATPATAANMFEYYPGNAYVDVVSADIYSDGYYYDENCYNSLKMVANGKPIALGECGILPDMTYLKTNQPDYVFFIMWAEWVDNDKQTDEWRRTVYHDAYCYNRGEIPSDLPDVDGPGILPDLDPSEFSDLYVADRGSDYITLQWRDFEANASGYKVLWNNQEIADVWYSSIAGGYQFTVSSDNMPITMEPDTAYSFKIQAYGGAEVNWAWLSSREITAYTTPSKDPYIFDVATDVSSITISLANVLASAANHITVYNTDADDEIVYDEDFTGNTITIGNLSGATNYRFLIYSIAEAFDDLEGTAQTTFPDLYVTDRGTDYITLRWRDFDSAAAGYKVLWNGQQIADVWDSNITGGYEFTVSSDNMPITMEPDTAYTFKIQAYGGAEVNWTWLSSREITAYTAYIAPSKNPSISKVSADASSITISLANISESDISHIIVYNTDANDAVVYNSDFTGNTITVENLDNATNYRFVISALDDSFEDLEGTAQTNGISVNSVTPDSITLGWHDFYPNKALYKIVYKNNATGEEKEYDEYGLQTTITGLAPDTSYTIKVWAIGGADTNWNWFTNIGIDVRTLALPTNEIISVENGTVQMQIGDAAALADYTLIVASYTGNKLEKVEFLQPATSVQYTVVDSDTTKAFLWNLETMQPLQ